MKLLKTGSFSALYDSNDSNDANENELLNSEEVPNGFLVGIILLPLKKENQFVEYKKLQRY
jgi:hypothetical protein